MRTASHLGYLQARLQARHGERLTEAGWQSLEATADMASYLQAARSTALRRLIGHLPGETDPHTAERSLRQDWRAHVEEIARWSPHAWQVAIRWWATLPDLAPIIHLSRGARVYRWMRDDPSIQPYTQTDPVARRKALAGSPLAPVLAAAAADVAPFAAWKAHWLSLIPANEQRSRSALERLARTMPGGVALTGAEVSPAPAGRSSRDALRRHFIRAFRKYARTPVAALAFLGVSLLEYDRLRGGLAVRAAFPDPARRPQWA